MLEFTLFQECRANIIHFKYGFQHTKFNGPALSWHHGVGACGLHVTRGGSYHKCLCTLNVALLRKIFQFGANCCLEWELACLF